MDNEPSRPATGYFAGTGPMARAVRSHDWSATPLGPVSGWPPALRAAVAICLDSQFQIMVLLGPELVYIYNDAAIPIFGDKHPRALGRRVAEVWPEAWDTVGPVLTRVRECGQAVRQDDWLLVLNRSGYAEETYFTLSYSPIRDDAGATVGVFVATMETTSRVLGERRQRTLRDLATEVALWRGDDDTLEPVRRALAANPCDVPLAALYVAPPGAGFAEQVFCTGLHPGCAGIDHRIAWPAGGAAPAGRHPLAAMASARAPRIYDGAALLSEGDRCGAWPEPPRQVIALPFAVPGAASPHAFLLMAVNPRAPLDAEYRHFIDTIAGLVATAVASFAAIEAERRLQRQIAVVRHDLASVLERTSDAFVSLDAALRVVSVNEAAALELGAGKQALIGRTLAEIVPDLAGSALEQAMRATLAGGGPVTVEQFHPTSKRWFNARCFAAPQGLIVFANEITERKEAEQVLLMDKRELERRVELRSEELKMLYERLQCVREEERTALAREVHDQLGQILSAAKIDVKLLEDDLRLHGAALAPERIMTELGSASATLDRAMRLVRDIATELRAPELDGQGLYAAIDWHARDFERRTRIAVHVECCAALAQPAPAAAEALLRIFREALTNVLRHAHAGCVWVGLEQRAGALLLRVRDDGAGITRRPARSLGITGMRERAALAGGRLLVGPLPGGGTLVSALVPALDRIGAAAGEAP
jgi:PAS domain S-box-containing protein